MKGSLIVFSNGNSFTHGSKLNGDGMVGLATFQGERLIYEWMPARLLSAVSSGAIY